MRKALYAGLSVLSLFLGVTCSLDTQPKALESQLADAGCSVLGTCDSGVGGSPGGQGGAAVGGGISIGTGGRVGMVAGGSGGSSPADAGPADAMTGMPDAQLDSGPPLLENGSVCSSDEACLSGHCDGICCAGGDCCKTVSDCNITTNGIALACNDVTQCQGSGGRIECSDFRCQAIGGEPNDSACTSMTVADNCGSFKPVFCNGMVDQQAPSCLTRCRSDDDCDANAHCIATGVCAPDLTSGGLCVRNEDCASGHCSQNVCCDRDDCCAQPSDCPASYSAAPTCDNRSICRGTRKAATCTRNICGSQMVDDDRACGNDIVVNDCALFADVHCNGNENQGMPMCLRTCTISSQCDGTAYCDNGVCMPKKANGETCPGARNEVCSSGVCGSNGLCCVDSNGQCCKTADQCTDPQYTVRACADLATCTGTIARPVCNAGGRCMAGGPVSDAAGCEGRTHSCGAGFQPQMVNCPTPCTCGVPNGPSCAMGFTCTNGQCVQNMSMAGTGG